MRDFLLYLWNKNNWAYCDKDSFLTFMSVLCINKNYCKESYNKLIKKIWYLKEELKNYSFNFSLIALSNVMDVRNSIVIIDNPICVYCIANRCWWTPNKKISQDLRFLIKYITSNYPVPYGCKKFFRKLKFVWCLWCESKVYRVILICLKKIRLYDFFSKIYRRIFLEK